MTTSPAPGLDADIAVFVGRAVAADAHGPLWADARFFEWLRDRAEAQDPDDLAIARGQALFARSLEKRHQVLRLHLGVPGRSSSDNGHERRVGSALIDESGLCSAGIDASCEPFDESLLMRRRGPLDDYLSLGIVGGDMAPLLDTGDRVLVQRGAEVRVNNVVVARQPQNGYVCKIVSRVTRRLVELISIRPAPPLCIPRDPSVLLGRVLIAWRAASRVGEQEQNE